MGACGLGQVSPAHARRKSRFLLPGRPNLAARVGRLWGLFRPIQTVDLMRDEGRERAVGIAGLIALYVTTAAGIAGAVILRRRRVPISPLVAPVSSPKRRSSGMRTSATEPAPA